MPSNHPLSDPLDILLTHDLWANRQLIEVCTPLSPEQFTREFAMGLGTIHKTLVHMASAIYRWSDALAGKTLRPALDAGKFLTPPSLLPAFEESSGLLRTQAIAKPLSDIVTRDLGGTLHHFTRGVVLMQITTHGTYHRAQIINMLRHIGVSPVPDPSVMKWSMAMSEA